MISGRVGVVKLAQVSPTGLDEFGQGSYRAASRDGGVWTRVHALAGVPPLPEGAQVLLLIPDEPRAQPWIVGQIPPNVVRDITGDDPTAPGADSAQRRSVQDLLLGALDGGQIAVLGRGGPLVRAAAGQAVKVEIEGGGFVRLAQRGAGDNERAALGRAVQAHLTQQRAAILRLQETVTVLAQAAGVTITPPLAPPDPVGDEVLSALLRLSNVSE